MTWEFFLKGFVIGFAIAAPVGPIGLLTIQRTLADGWRSGLATGIGAATADAAYGAVAAFGLTAIAAFLLDHRVALQAGGGAFLCVLGARTFLREPAPVPAAGEPRRARRAYLSSVFLTLTNPATILSFIAVFAGAGLARAAGAWAGAALMVAGVFLGSAAWWLVLVGFTDAWRQGSTFNRLLGGGRFSGAVMAGYAAGTGLPQLRWINRISGALLAGFGAAVLGRTLM
jgi:threonine/homoserine/homoserine lactone efflux protein